MMRRLKIVTWALLALIPVAGSAAESRSLAGRPLLEALAQLQTDGLRIVYSSAVVTPAMVVLDPNAFSRVNGELNRLIESHALWCATIEGTVKSALADDDVSPVAIQRRTKHAAGVWRKMQEKNLRLEEVHDLFAFRIVVPNQDNCYLALDTVHRLFEPEPFRFKDYIAEPKANGYQSLHTSVRDRDGFVFEVQIRTVEMHRAAEEGIAAHWRYRASKSIRA